MDGGITGKGFKKGQSGNPNGRPKGVQSIPDILRKIGEEEGTKSGDLTKLQYVMRKVFDFAVEGRPWAVQFIADRTEGKAVERYSDVSNLEDVLLEVGYEANPMLVPENGEIKKNGEI